MDLTELDYREFELLVGMLLTRCGFQILRAPIDSGTGPGTLGVDFEALGLDSIPTFIEVKHFRRSAILPTSVVDHILGEFSRIRAQHPNAQGILVTSGKLSLRAEDHIKQQQYIQIWDGGVINSLLVKYPDISSRVNVARSHRIELSAQMASLIAGRPRTPSHAERLVSELQSLAAGRSAWQDYEKLGSRFLTELFSPQLGAPEVQSRSEDGLDILDAIFPIRSSEPPWSLIRSEYQSRFVVAEFKNYQEPIGQRQVESIAQYLWKKAHRSFGLLLSRRGPDKSAHLARRRAWIEQDKLIVFLDDEDLVDMARLWDEEAEPYSIIDAQLEDFFRTLSP